MRFVLTLAGIALFCGGTLSAAHAHCQVPCGIYDDSARIESLREDATTIAKAMDNIAKLSGAHSAQATNQLIRWTNTKEMHATHIIDVVSEYFLTQKLKPVAPGNADHDAYVDALTAHHAVLRAAMKTKQSTDRATVTALEEAIETLAGHW